MRSLLTLCVAASLAFSYSAIVSAADAPSAATGAASYDQAISKSIDFLKTRQGPEGAFNKQRGPGITAIITNGLLRQGRSPDDPMVAKALKFLESYLRTDGGFYTEGQGVQNYETALVILCLADANKDHRYDKLIKGAEKYLKTLQWDESEDKNEADLFYGGAGYGHSKRPDLSNTAFFVDALKAAGDGPDDESLKKALVFVSRCQNFESAKNTTPFATKNPDGGFYYTPAAGGNSGAGTTPDGGLRSYGSMTYAGLRSMIYAGVGPDDPRVKAAVQWIGEHYDIKANPGMDQAGVFYYYHTFAKALDAIGQKEFVDKSGATHDWRSELRAELLGRQKPDGSWSNSNSRWMENDPDLVTGYALLTLSYVKP